MRTIPYEMNDAGVCTTPCPHGRKDGGGVYVNSMSCTKLCPHYAGKGSDFSIICEHPEVE